MSSKSSSPAARHSLTIRSKVTLNRILEATSNSVKMEINDEGRITGRYTGTQLATIESTASPDGTSTWNGKFMQMTNKGEMIVATGSGTGEPASSKGIVKIRGAGQMWTQSTRLSNLNGAKWTCEGQSNIRNGRTVIYVDINNIYKSDKTIVRYIIYQSFHVIFSCDVPNVILCIILFGKNAGTRIKVKRNTLS